MFLNLIVRNTKIQIRYLVLYLPLPIYALGAKYLLYNLLQLVNTCHCLKFLGMLWLALY